MLRKLLLLILFLAFSGLVLGLLTAERGGIAFLDLSGHARPSTRPLPQPWEEGRAVVRLAGQPTEAPVVGAVAPGSTCPVTVSVQRGDTLGTIAKRCGISLNELLAANPTITNPNRIYVGQELLVHGERGGGAAAGGGGSAGAGAAEPVSAQPAAAGFSAGAQVVVEAGGFVPDARVKIGIGLPGAGFQSLGVYTAGADGRLSATLTIPQAARSGERAFFLLTSTGAPTVTVISEAFVIE